MSDQPRATLGRIVHFKPATQDTSPAHLADVYPGMVTGTYDDDPAEPLDVVTFGQRSTYFQIHVMPLDPEKPEAGGWFWPPRT